MAIFRSDHAIPGVPSDGGATEGRRLKGNVGYRRTLQIPGYFVAVRIDGSRALESR